MAFSGAFLAASPLRRKVRIQYPLLLARNIIISSYDNQPVGVCLPAGARQSRRRPPTRRLRRVRE